MAKYLYLAQHSYLHAWTNGGLIPINLASTYLAAHREGNKTPDENIIHRGPVDLSGNSGLPFKFNHVKSLTMENIWVDDMRLPDVEDGALYAEDGLILSFCNRKSSDICARLNKVVCIAIDDIERLKQVIDAHLKVEGRADLCAYTNDHQRNHFLKSTADAWQDEFRIFWNIRPPEVPVWVPIPRSTGRSIKMKRR